MKIYFDGGAAPNPGPMHVCIVVDGEPLIQQLEHGTNNLAEWTALCWGLLVAKMKGAKEVELIGDSMLAISQANGSWKIKKKDFLPFKQEYDRLVKDFEKVEVRFVPRGENVAGHEIERFLKSR